MLPGPQIPTLRHHPFLSGSTNSMPQDRNSWGRVPPRTPGSPRSKPLAAFEKKFFHALQISALIRSVAGRSGGVGPGVRGPTAGPVGAEPALRSGLRRAGAERAGGVRRSHRDHPVPWRQSENFPLMCAVVARAGAIVAVQTGPSVDPDVPKLADLAVLGPFSGLHSARWSGPLGRVGAGPRRPWRRERGQAGPGRWSSQDRLGPRRVGTDPRVSAGDVQAG
jgi:hypothetical protein